MAFGSRGSKRSATNQTVTSTGGYHNEMNSSIMDNTEGQINGSMITNEDVNSSMNQNPYTLQGTGAKTIPQQNTLSPELMK